MSVQDHRNAHAVGAGGPLSTRALDHVRWADLHRTLAGRHLRTFRPGSAPLCADAVPSGAVDPAARDGPAAVAWGGNFRTSGAASADRTARDVPDRSP